MQSVTKLEELLKDWLKSRGDKQQLAKQIFMSPSGFGRGLAKGTLSVENLLNLADVTGIHPAHLMESAGKERFSKLIERFYGTETMQFLPMHQRRLLDQLSSLNTSEQIHLIGLIEALALRARDGASPLQEVETAKRTRRSAKG